MYKCYGLPQILLDFLHDHRIFFCERMETGVNLSQSQITGLVVLQQCPHLIPEQEQGDAVEEYRERCGDADDGPEQTGVGTGKIDEGAHAHHGQREDDGKCPVGDLLDCGPLFEQELQHILVVEIPGSGGGECKDDGHDAYKIFAQKAEGFGEGQHTQRRTPGAGAPHIGDEDGKAGAHADHDGIAEYFNSAPQALAYGMYRVCGTVDQRRSTVSCLIGVDRAGNTLADGQGLDFVAPFPGGGNRTADGIGMSVEKFGQIIDDNVGAEVYGADVQLKPC